MATVTRIEPPDYNPPPGSIRALIEFLSRASGPGAYVELPFDWPESSAPAGDASKVCRSL